MTPKQIDKKLEELENSFKDKENEVFKQMKYMRDHKFHLEEEALRYKQEAYNECWLEIWHLRFDMQNK